MGDKEQSRCAYSKTSVVICHVRDSEQHLHIESFRIPEKTVQVQPVSGQLSTGFGVVPGAPRQHKPARRSLGEEGPREMSAVGRASRYIEERRVYADLDVW